MTAFSLTHHQLFPTRLSLLQWDDATLNDELAEMFAKEPVFHREDFPDIADASNLLELANRYPALLRLRDMFLEGLKSWLQAEKIEGRYRIETYLFPNYSKTGEFIPAHNHLAHVSGIYYVKTSDYGGRDVLFQGGAAEYWHTDRGVLILHDPRFNASLAELQTNHYAKLFPKPGLMGIFPSYLWHSVTPHHEGFDRIAISVNFTLVPLDGATEPHAISELVLSPHASLS